MTRLLVMAKAPVPGSVKTRLRLPPETAAALQIAFIRDTIQKARAIAPVTVAATPPEALHLVRPLLPDGVRSTAQSGEDLGERMLDAALRLFERAPEPVVILGTDAPTLPPRSIRAAAAALEGESTHDDLAIIGSTDGGYVLLGLRKPHEALFRDIEWSTQTVHRETLQKARNLGLRVHEGEPHYDVDTPRDLQRLEEELANNPEAAPHTARLLKDPRTQKGREPE